MSSLMRVTSMVLLLSIVFLGYAHAQFQVNVTGNRILPLQTGRSDQGLWGGGASLRYFVNPHLAIGINGRQFGRSYHLNFGTEAYDGKTYATTLTGQMEYFLTQAKLQPYLGIETGLYRYKDVGEGAWQPLTSSISNNFTVAPKFGLQYKITSAFGLNVEASYCFISQGSYSPNSLLVSGGGYFRLGSRY